MAIGTFLQDQSTRFGDLNCVPLSDGLSQVSDHGRTRWKNRVSCHCRVSLSFRFIKHAEGLQN